MHYCFMFHEHLTKLKIAEPLGIFQCKRCRCSLPDFYAPNAAKMNKEYPTCQWPRELKLRLSLLTLPSWDTCSPLCRALPAHRRHIDWFVLYSRYLLLVGLILLVNTLLRRLIRVHPYGPLSSALYIKKVCILQ